MLEKITRIGQKVKILCVLLSHELLSTKTYSVLHINLHTPILFIIFFMTSSKIQK